MMLLLTSSCRRCTDPSNPDCKNYDPCFGKGITNAQFTVDAHYTSNNGGVDAPWKSFTMDSIVPPWSMLLKFDAIGDAESYSWILGKDTFRNQEAVFTDFGGVPFGGPYPVTLIVHRTPDFNCHPLDDGWDTVVRNYYRKEICQLKVSGKFRLKSERDVDSIDMVLNWIQDRYHGFRDSCNTTTLEISNGPQLKDTLYLTGDLLISDHILELSQDRYPYKMFKFNFVPSNETFELRYELKDSSQGERYYHGRKLE